MKRPTSFRLGHLAATAAAAPKTSVDTQPISLAPNAAAAAAAPGSLAVAYTPTDEVASGAAHWMQEGLKNVLYQCSVGPVLYRPLAGLLMLWECCQFMAFCLSASPALPWLSLPVMADVSRALQVICFGYHIPSGTGLATAQFAIMFSLACLTVLGIAVLTVVDHPALDEHRLALKWPYTPLRWLAMGVAHSLYLPMIVQLVSSLRCSATVPFLDSTSCWSSVHSLLAVLSVLLLPCIIGIAALSSTSLFDANPQSKDPLARPHGRIILLLQLVKLALAIIFAIDGALDKWILAIAAVLASAVALYLFVVYLPFSWQRLNQIGAAGFATSGMGGLVLLLAASRGPALGTTAAWLLLFTLPCAAIIGFVLATMRWNLWVTSPTMEIGNVYLLELKVRRLLATDMSESAFDFVEALFIEALRYFPTASILHLFVAQYMHNVRQNRHLERCHLNALLARRGAIDEVMFAYMRIRRINEEADTADQRTLAARVRFEKLRTLVREQVLQARRLQTKLWGELAAPSPHAAKVLQAAGELAACLRACDRTFDQLLSLNPNSVVVIRLYAQYVREVANDRAKADELVQQASEIEAQQMHAQSQEQDFVFMALVAPLDASQDNVGLIVASNQPATLGNVLDANAVACQLVGYTKRELLGANVKVITPEPIQTVHQTYLQAYLDTGRGSMLNVTRTLFAVHKAGYLIPIAETARALDSGFNLVAAPVVTSDNFVIVALPTLKITGICQRTMAQSKLAGKDIRTGVHAAQVLIPAFDQLWTEFQQAVQEYEAHAFDATSQKQLVAPSNVQFAVTMMLHGNDGLVETPVHVRLQHVKVKDASFVLIKWVHQHGSAMRDPPANTSAAGTNAEDHGSDDDGDSLSAGSLALSGMSSHDDSDEDIGSALGVMESKENPAGPSPTGSGDKGVKFKLPHQNEEGPAPRHSKRSPVSFDAKRPATARSEKPNAGSGRSSQGSSTSSTMRSYLARMLARSTQVIPPSVLRLNRAFLMMLSLSIAIVIANNVGAQITVSTAEHAFSLLVRVGDRMAALEEAALRMQDIFLHEEAIVPLSDSMLSARRAEMTKYLDDFEVLHRGLYVEAQSIPELNAMYSDVSLTLQQIDSFKRVRSVPSNTLNAGVAVVAAGRLALAGAVAEFTRASTHVWYMRTNIPAILANFGRFLQYHTADNIRDIADMEAIRLIVFISAICTLLVLAAALVLPLLVHIRRSREQSLAVYLEIPISVMRSMHRYSEHLLSEAIQAAEEDGDAGSDDEEDKAVAVESITASINAAATAPAEVRHFQTEHASILAWMAQLFTPVLLLLAFLVGMFFWGRIVTSSLASYSVEMQLAARLALAPAKAYYELRHALLTPNATADTWSVPLQLTHEVSHLEQLVTLGDATSLFGAPARPGLRLPNIADTFLRNGCVAGDNACLEFYDGIFASGLHAAVTESVKLMEQTIADRTAHVSTPSTNAEIASTLTSPAVDALNVMMHAFLTKSLRRAESMIDSAAMETSESFQTWLIVVSVLAIVFILATYWFFLRRMFQSLTAELRLGQQMLLWLPEEVLQNVAAVKQSLKKLRAV